MINENKSSCYPEIETYKQEVCSPYNELATSLKNMGYKKVCLDCRKAFNRPINLEKENKSICPQCENPMTELYHLFQPPKQTEKKKWEVVKYLVENGFRYYHVWETINRNSKGEITSYQNYTKYPDNMNDAKEFVEKYQDQALKQ